jgi:hypothetical protein
METTKPYLILVAVDRAGKVVSTWQNFSYETLGTLTGFLQWVVDNGDHLRVAHVKCVDEAHP